MNSSTILSSQVAYLLVFHGSHDSRSQRAAKTLTQAFQQAVQQTPHIAQAVGQTLSWESSSSIANPSIDQLPGSTDSMAQGSPVLVQDAYLECFPLALHQQITQFAQQTKATLGDKGLHQIVVIPVFLLAGTHVMKDIPEEVSLAQTLIGETTTLKVTPHFGSHTGLHRLITERMASQPLEAWILLVHGSRHPGANQTIEAMAHALGAIAAYWSTEPKLEACIQVLAETGLQRIGIFPYFLFSGAITEAIAQNVSHLVQRWPHLTLTLVEPLEASQEFANLLVDFMQKS